MGATRGRIVRAGSAGLVVAVAAAVRLLYAVDMAPAMYSRHQEGTRMAARYDGSALGILAGEGVLFPRDPDPADTARLARPPGYALFVAVVYATLGRSFFAVQLVQDLLNAAGLLLVLLLGARLFGWAAGVAAGVLAAVSSHLAFTSNLILADALCPLPILGAVLLLVRAEAREHAAPARLEAVLAGALLGAACWLRPNVVLLAPFLVPFVVLASRRRREAAARAVVMTTAAVAVIAPITLRNWMVYGEWVPVSINGGLTLLQGVADAGARGFLVRPRDKMVIEEEAAAEGDPRLAESWAFPDGIRRDRERYALAWSIVRERPLWYARAMARRMGDMLAYWRGGPALLAPRAEVTAAVLEEKAALEVGDPRPFLSPAQAVQPGLALDGLRALLAPAQELVRWVVLPLAMVGLAFGLRAAPRAVVWLAAVPLYYLVFESMFLYEWRVAVPMHPFLLVLAGSGLVGLGRRLIRRPARLQKDAG